MKKEYARFLLEKTRQDYNTIAEDFSKTRRRPWKELGFLAQHSLAGDKVLDLGCGNGRLLEVFKDKNINYIGIDNSQKLIEIAKKLYPKERFQKAEATNLSFPSNYFDRVYSIAVLHHIPSKEFRLHFLQEAKRVLRPGGLLILTVWNLWQWHNWKLLLEFTLLKILGKSKLDFGDVFVPWGKSFQRYFHNFSRRELRKLLRETGFTIKEMNFLARGRIKKANIYLIAQK